MAAGQTRADSLREYLTGAASDGGVQADVTLSLGNYRSSSLASSFGVTIASAITNLVINFASGGNPSGSGQLQALDANTLRWKPYGAISYGPPAVFAGPSEDGIVEANDNPGQYLHVTGSPPFSVGVSTITLTPLVSGFFGFPEISVANALAGLTQYRASIVRNESSGPVTLFKRWIASLGPPATTNGAQLGASGAGTIISGAGAFLTWPQSGWARIETNAGVLREIVYYDSRTNNSLNVTSRARLGSSNTAGASTDVAYPVPGIAIAKDPDGVEAFGSNIQTVANETTAPTGVTWNTGIREATGLDIGTLNPNQQIGFWFKREVPAGAKATALANVRLSKSFSAY